MGQNGVKMGSKWGQNGSQQANVGQNGSKWSQNVTKILKSVNSIVGLFMSGRSSKIWPKKVPKGPF